MLGNTSPETWTAFGPPRDVCEFLDAHCVAEACLEDHKGSAKFLADMDTYRSFTDCEFVSARFNATVRNVVLTQPC